MHQPHLPQKQLRFFEVKSNYCSSASARTLSVCVRVHARAPERARARAPLKTPSDERAQEMWKENELLNPAFIFPPFKLQL